MVSAVLTEKAALTLRRLFKQFCFQTSPFQRNYVTLLFLSNWFLLPVQHSLGRLYLWFKVDAQGRLINQGIYTPTVRIRSCPFRELVWFSLIYLTADMDSADDDINNHDDCFLICLLLLLLTGLESVYYLNGGGGGGVLAHFGDTFWLLYYIRCLISWLISDVTS